jgi:hypothetical protein
LEFRRKAPPPLQHGKTELKGLKGETMALGILIYWTSLCYLYLKLLAWWAKG